MPTDKKRDRPNRFAARRIKDLPPGAEVVEGSQDVPRAFGPPPPPATLVVITRSAE